MHHTYECTILPADQVFGDRPLVDRLYLVSQTSPTDRAATLSISPSARDLLQANYRAHSHLHKRSRGDPLNPDLLRYRCSIAYTDRLLTDFVLGLEAEGRLENTLLVVAGDHGEGFREHGFTKHGQYSRGS